MAYVITGTCVADYSCVEACPADCIHPTPDEPAFWTAHQLYVDPLRCVDCDACRQACPVDAVRPQDALPPGQEHYRTVNAAWFGRGS